MANVRRLISPQDWQKRQLDTLNAVGQANYKLGVQNPRKDPIQAGIAAEDSWRNGLKAAQDRNARVKGLEKTNMAEWAGYAENIGAGKLVEGVTKRAAKVSKFLTSYVPLLTDTVQKLDQMPTATASDRNAKVIANLEALRALKGQA